MASVVPTELVVPTVPVRWSLHRSSGNRDIFWPSFLLASVFSSAMFLIFSTVQTKSFMSRHMQDRVCQYSTLNPSNRELCIRNFIGSMCEYTFRVFVNEYTPRHLVMYRIRTVHSPQNVLVSTPQPLSSPRTKIVGCEVTTNYCVVLLTLATIFDLIRSTTT